MRWYKCFKTIWKISNPIVTNLCIVVHPADASIYAPALLSHSPPSSPTLSSPLDMTTCPTMPSVVSPLPPSSLIMSPLSPYLVANLTSSPSLSLPSPSISPPITYSVISPVITPAGILLNNEKPVFIIFWNQVSSNLWNEMQLLN